MEHVPRGDTESDLVTLENGWKGGDFESNTNDISTTNQKLKYATN